MVYEFYCAKCKRKTASTDVERIKTVNDKWRLRGRCVECLREKSTFTKASVPGIVDVKFEEARELHRPVTKKFPKRKIVTLHIDDLWAADLVIMDKFFRENDGYKYMLNVIDTFSKYAWSEPLLRKSGVEVTNAFEAIIQRAKGNGHKAPNLLHTYKGREFVNKDFKCLLAKHGIKMYHTENEEKSSIVERFNRTLNERMKVHFEARGSFRWIDILQGLLSKYNTSVHSTIRMRPVNVTVKVEPEIRSLYLDQFRSVKRPRPKLRVGDRVRIVAKKDTFANKYA
ncbi:uncharacterized protein LOC129005599 [Macrosteles quadrilineatus]|uniref:uncharacterized protein LOC129005599 n=1 Tax=Macrosteles quadrilineatus TaxID=74068 RepID=UPI0023E0D489|nr:uncharacterized protein LOC129005599 [Macrosteles quadrilineatus]